MWSQLKQINAEFKFLNGLIGSSQSPLRDNNINLLASGGRGWALEIGTVDATAGGTNSGIIYGFNNFLETKLLDSTTPVEWIVV